MSIKDTLVHRWLRRPYKLAVAIDEGKGPTVILLHGIASRGSAWQRLATILADSGRRVVAYDLLGFGESPKPEWPRYDVEMHARMVASAIQRGQLASPVILVGHSMGCLIAAHIAFRYPSLVERVILYEPPVLADAPEFGSHQRRRKIYLSIFERIADSPSAVLTYARLFNRAIAKIAQIALTAEQWVPFEKSLRNTVISQNVYAELKTISVPTDIVYGRLDLVVNQAEIKQMFAGNNNIHFGAITDTHGISKRASAYLANLISSKTSPHNRPKKKISHRVASRKQKHDNS